MISAERRAQVTWTGTLAEGSGRLRVASGAAPDPWARGGKRWVDQKAVPFMQSMPAIQ